mgnify:CR=1 FL=1
MLLEAEQLFHERLPHGTVLRCSGLYAGDSTRLLDRVREGADPDPGRWTNRIHRDDAAAAVVHLLTRTEAPDPVYLGNDDEPALLGDVAREVARLLGEDPPPAADHWNTTTVTVDDADYVVDSRDWFVDVDVLVKKEYLTEVPASVSPDNSQSGTGSYSWYVDEDGELKSMLYSYPRPETDGFQEVYP